MTVAAMPRNCWVMAGVGQRLEWETEGSHVQRHADSYPSPFRSARSPSVAMTRSSLSVDPARAERERLCRSTERSLSFTSTE